MNNVTITNNLFSSFPVTRTFFKLVQLPIIPGSRRIDISSSAGTRICFLESGLHSLSPTLWNIPCRFMEAVWPEGTDAVQSQSNTPVRPAEDAEEKEDDKKKKKAKLSSEGWSQESDLEEELEKRWVEELGQAGVSPRGWSGGGHVDKKYKIYIKKKIAYCFNKSLAINKYISYKMKCPRLFQKQETERS